MVKIQEKEIEEFRVLRKVKSLVCLERDEEEGGEESRMLERIQ